MTVKTKRVYEPAADSDGQRVLVDRVWPRGVSKDDAELTDWRKELAPSTDLRKWFGHRPERWAEFKKRYARELDVQDEALNELADRAEKGNLTLVYAAKDEEHNNAEALREMLERRVGKG